MWASRSKWPKPPTPSTPIPTRSPLEPGSSSTRGRRGQGATNPPPPTPPPPLPAPHSNTLPRHPMPPMAERIGRAQRKLGMGKGTNKGRSQDRADRARQKQCRAQKEENERTKGKESVRLLEAPVRKKSCRCTPQRAQVSAGVGKPGMDSVHLDAPGQRHGQQPVSGTADPGVVKQDKSSWGSVDTTRTCSDPQRVRMSSGERPIGAAKGKQPNTEALCQPPPPPPSSSSNASEKSGCAIGSSISQW